jgi:thiamine biosynthesis lipoprotein
METMTREFEAIGTQWHIYCEFEDTVNVAHLLDRIARRINMFDRNYSRFRNDSLVADISHAAGTYRLPPDAQPMFELYQHLYTLTDGAFTPLIGSVLAAAGYDAAYSFTATDIHQPLRWDEALDIRWPYLTVHAPVLLDVGAAGKGYLVDIIAHILRNAGAVSYVINAGGDIATYSADAAAIRIGLEHPDDPSQAIGIAAIANQSIAGSAGNRRRWGQFHHIIDPRTLESPHAIRATWVVAETTMLADALATCLYLVQPQHLAAHYAFEYVVLHDDYSISQSSDFPAELFIHHE